MIRLRTMRLFPLFLVVGLEGCSVLPAHAPQPTYHDFGLPKIAAVSRVPAALTAVTAPPWLDTGKILYRPADDPTALHAYATQRWIAPPAELLAQQLREHLEPALTSGYSLTVRLNHFEQDFEQNGSAHALMDLQVCTIGSDGQILASRDFAFSTSTAPNVTGAVRGLSALAKRAQSAILGWTRSATTQAKP